MKHTRKHLVSCFYTWISLKHRTLDSGGSFANELFIMTKPVVSGHMASPGPECGRPWLRKPCHSLSYGILFWQKASGCMFSFRGKHPKPALLQFIISMPFRRLACFSWDKLCGHALLLEGRHASAICAHTVRTTASACAAPRDGGKSDHFRVFSGEGAWDSDQRSPRTACRSYFFSSV